MNRKVLQDALDLLYPAVASKPLAVELGAFRLNGRLARTSDAIMSVQVDFGSDTGLNCLIPADELYKLLRSLAVDEIGLAVDGDAVVLTAGKVKGRFAIIKDSPILDALNFDVDNWSRDNLSGLLAGLNLCSFSASKDASRGALCGISVNGNTILSSDGSRISRYVVKSTTPLAATQVLVPLTIATRAINHGPAVSAWAAKGDTVYFRIGETCTVASKTIQGAFPDPGPFFDDAKTITEAVTFPINITESLKRHQDLQQELEPLNRKVDLEITGNTVLVKSNDAARYQLEEELTLETAVKEPFTLSINPAFMVDILGKTRTMRYSSAKSFVVFEFETDHGQFTHLAMTKKA